MEEILMEDQSRWTLPDHEKTPLDLEAEVTFSLEVRDSLAPAEVTNNLLRFL